MCIRDRYETVLLDHPEVGSICSGGRYDDLAGYYTNKSLPGVRSEEHTSELQSPEANSYAVFLLCRKCSRFLRISNSVIMDILYTVSYTHLDVYKRQVVGYLPAFGVPEENFELDLTIARGLDYYTGTVYELSLIHISAADGVAGFRRLRLHVLDALGQ